MEQDTEMWNKTASVCYDNFVYTYYPATIYLSDSLDIFDVLDKPLVALFDMRIFNPYLSKSLEFNRYIFEVLFMYLNLETQDDFEEHVNLIMDEIDGGAFESIVGEELYNKNRPQIDRDIIRFLLKNISQLFYNVGNDVLVMGWKKDMKDLSLGVLYV